MYIETGRMLIREFTPEDAADLHEILGDAETMEHCEPAYDFEKTKAFLTSFCIGRKAAAAAVHKESGKMVGYILFNELEKGVFEMGWFFNRSFWRQGLAYESCKAVIDCAFAERNAHKVFVETIDAVKSVGLMQKLGMQLEGIQRSQTRGNHGNWADLYFYGLLEEDWRRSMEIKFENIILRDMIESDIEDYVRWFTTETEWSKTDAPWEPIESDEDTERTSWREYYESVKELPDDVRRWKFEIEWNGRHIGWVSSYPIDENYEWIGEIKDSQTVYRAIGIDICESDMWGHGIGTNALRAFISYYFENGVDELYTQTWSGNTRMIRCAGKLGFVECKRNIGTRVVDGQKYDGLTFRLEKCR